MSILKNLLTERDGESYCPVRVGIAGAGLVYHAGLVFMVLRQHAAIDMAMLGAYVQQVCTLVGTAALGIGAKSAMKGDADSANPTAQGN